MVTTLGGKLKDAGVDTDAAALRVLAEECLRLGDLNINRVVGKFQSRVSSQGLGKALAQFYLEIVLADMKGTSSAAGGQSCGAGDGHRKHAPGGGSVEDGEGQCAAVSNDHDQCVSSSSPLPGDGQEALVEPDFVSTAITGKPSPAKPPPAKPLSAAELEALKELRERSITIFDTHKIDGIPIGDWTVAAAIRAGKKKTSDGRLLLVLARKVANADPSAKLRDVVKLTEVQAAIQEATEVFDAA